MPKKDKGTYVRRAQFIEVAGELFATNGYNGTSIRDILDAMGDAVNSPSVFYYYFKSKDDIYQAVLQRQKEQYLAALEACVRDEARNPLEAIADILRVFIGAMGRRVVSREAAEGSFHNAMFNAYLLAEIEKKGAEIWAPIIFRLPWGSRTREESRRMAAFLNGGIGALTRDYSGSGDGDAAALAGQIICFCADVLHAPESERDKFKALLSAIESERED